MTRPESIHIGVTGASGFVGSHLVTALKGYGKVVTLSRNRSLPTPAQLKFFASGVELVFHLGGVNRGTDEEILIGNITGTQRLIEAIRKYGKPSAKILFASSVLEKFFSLYKKEKQKNVQSTKEAEYTYHLAILIEFKKSLSSNINTCFAPILVFKYPYKVIWLTCADCS